VGRPGELVEFYKKQGFQISSYEVTCLPDGASCRAIRLELTW
jgi:hypothetical protein